MKSTPTSYKSMQGSLPHQYEILSQQCRALPCCWPWITIKVLFVFYLFTRLSALCEPLLSQLIHKEICLFQIDIKNLEYMDG